MSIFGVGPWEIILILIVALIVFGPDKLPEVAGQVGRTIRDFRRWTADLTAEFHAVTEEFTAEFSELKATAQELSDELRAVQGELADEVRSVNEALHPETGEPLRLQTGEPALNPALPQTVSQATAMTATYGATALTSAADDTSVTNGNGAKVASKDDPTADVSLLDLDELVVMPRTSPPPNGHHPANGAPEPSGAEQATAAPRLPRTGRRAAAYQRPRARKT
jgi:TatA/E family protein of Tat protein translocase